MKGGVILKCVSYESIIEFYDLIHAELADDIEFVHKLATQTGDPVLELGCGTGRLLLPLARRGHQVTGLDNSSGMLGKAKEKLILEPQSVKDHVTLREGDMTSFRLERSFSLILIPHNTLLHLPEGGVGSCFQCCRSHLQERGVLFIDVDNPFEMADRQDDNLVVLERKFNHPHSGLRVLQMASSRADDEIQVRHTTWMFDTMPEDGGYVQRIVTEMEFHYYYPHQLEILLNSAGFTITAIHGGYAGEPFNASSSHLIILAASGAPR